MDKPNGFRALLGPLLARGIGALLPNRCLLCGVGDIGPALLCPACRGDLRRNHRACRVCALPLAGQAPICGHCLRQPPPFDAARIPLLYVPPCDFLIRAFKFEGRLGHGRALTEAVVDAFRGDPPQLLIPVPLHQSRMRARGFNQSHLIAADLGRALDIPLDAGFCRRRRRTWTQTGLTARQRRRNLRDAFEVSGNLGADHVAIVDDVVTTGSTVAELARLLKRHGVSRVEVWALARTPPRNDP